MSHPVKFSIGGVTACASTGPLVVSPPDPVYRSFMVEHAADAGAPLPLCDIRVEVSTDLVPDGPGPVLFTAASVWRMEADPPGYRLHVGNIDRCRAHTVVVSDPETTNVQVFVQQDRGTDEPASGPIANPFYHPVDQLLIMNHLSTRGGTIIHAAGFTHQGSAVALLGASGAGKSTLSRLLIGAGLADGLLSDDRIIVRLRDAGVVEAWGTPWLGDAGIAANQTAPLRALVFLTKSDATSLVPLDARVAARRLMPVVSIPWYDRERGPQVMETCSRLLERTPCYELRFRPLPEVVDPLLALTD